MSEVKVGQIWKDNDKRACEKFLRITAVGELKAEVEASWDKSQWFSNRPILLKRFKPNATGYRLVEDVDA